ncbi:hypothetical protein M758_12G052200 [Ceratodon purpureus]|nr:hypothetical protein M758_12G052200 [Ceratodon purpureus]
MPNQETCTTVPGSTVKVPSVRHLSMRDASGFSSLCRSRALDPTLKNSSPGPGVHIVSPQLLQSFSTCTEPSTALFSVDSMQLAPSYWKELSPCDPQSEGRRVKKCSPVITRSGHSLEKIRVYVGFDSREELAYEVCRHSLLKHATVSLEIIPLKLQNLTKEGIYTRPRDPTESTEFSFTRFLTPFLAGFESWALFVDCDFLYTADLRELAELIDDRYAVMCVHHDYTPKATVKMDGVLQTSYPRKNWSSMVLYNCAHPKNKVLTPELVNSASGSFLHRFMWLEDADIGELPITWNFLVGHNELPKKGASIPKAIHFTCGGPWFEAWKDCEFADHWLKERDEYWNTQLYDIASC